MYNNYDIQCNLSTYCSRKECFNGNIKCKQILMTTFSKKGHTFGQLPSCSEVMMTKKGAFTCKEGSFTTNKYYIQAFTRNKYIHEPKQN